MAQPGEAPKGYPAVLSPLADGVTPLVSTFFSLRPGDLGVHGVHPGHPIAIRPKTLAPSSMSTRL
jgi:hypothetical protein